ncbi:hypothetical protein Ddye_006669 [Dipteronia dyeriana]|uniref:Uncharacterized protein n=1 Tax=Dipteronia dyeriana TaxID=168575 RepID=A0AAD9XIF3_9ROSI|nr:hypothetical protein Ddye_006669 [Dipteronia dyeriana]
MIPEPKLCPKASAEYPSFINTRQNPLVDDVCKDLISSTGEISPGISFQDEQKKPCLAKQDNDIASSGSESSPDDDDDDD